MSEKTIWVINQFAGTPESGWGERHYYLAKGWLEQGYRVLIISTGNNHMFKKPATMQGLYTLDNYQGVEFLWIKTPSYNPKNFTRFFAMFFFTISLWGLLALKKKIGRPTYIIHSSMSIFPAPMAYFLKKRLKAQQFVFEVRDLWPLTPIELMGYSRKHPFIRIISWFEKFAYRRADKIVSVLRGSEKHINKISNAPEKYHYLPNGFDLSLLPKNQSYNGDSLKIPTDRLVVGYAGTIGFANALDPFFEAISSLAKSAHSPFFVILGDGYMKDTYAAQVADCNNCVFISKVRKETVSHYISKFDICFIGWHTSNLYKYGVSANKYFDYMAAAKPILSAQSGIQDPVKLSGAGLIVENTPEGIVNGLLEFSNMPSADRKQLGEKGKEFVFKYHTYNQLSTSYLEILEQ